MRKNRLSTALLLLPFAMWSCKKQVAPQEADAAAAATTGSKLSTQSVNYTATGKFYTTGNKIIDPNGKEFIAKGTNVPGYKNAWPGTTLADLDKIVNKWKFNLIRLNCRFDYRDTTGGSNNNNDIDAIISAYTTAHIVVVVEDHKISGLNNSSEQAAAVTKFTSLATTYKNNPYVWFDIYNEPKGDMNTWYTQSTALVDAIRGTGATNIVMVAGTNWAQDAGGTTTCGNIPTADSFILTKGPSVLSGRTNVVFDLHVYNQWNPCETNLEDFIERVAALNLPMVVGEYGHQNGDSGPITDAATSYMFDLFPARNIGRIQFGWWGGDTNDLTTGGNGGGWNATYDGSNNATNLTSYGTLVWNDLRALNNSIANAEFDTGVNTWNVYNTAGATGTISQATGQGLSGNNSLKVNIVPGGAGTADWHLTAYTSCPVVNGKTYNISFIAKAGASRTVKFGVQGSSITHYIKTVTVTTTATTFTGSFTATASDSGAAFKFFLGGNDTDPIIDKVVITEQ